MESDSTRLTKPRPDWDDYFILIAQSVSTRADCSRRRVGAVIVKDHRIVATGYNGAPAGEVGCLAGACPRAHGDAAPFSQYESGDGACIAVHAEANALLYANRDQCEGATMYLTIAPCSWCQKLIKGAGISRVVWPEGELTYGRVSPTVPNVSRGLV